MPLATILALLVSANATIHPEKPGIVVRNGNLQGIPLCVWNDSSLFTKLRPGMMERGDKVFRFPNGSFSDIYHWNGTGAYNADSVWVPDNTTYTPGWKATSIHRGVSTSTDASLIDDGDTTTFWWSNADHPSAPGWFVVDLAAAKTVDSIALWLGTVRPDSVQVLVWTGSNAVYPAPYTNMDGKPWTTLARIPSSSFVSWRPAPEISVRFSARYVAVRPIGATPGGWQVREFKAFSGTKESTIASKTGTAQSPVFAISTMPASRGAAYVPNWDFDTYMKWINNYPGSKPLVCVNYGTGTPEEAAAWVHYANIVKGYNIKTWQVGNESSGQWEESGCVTARQYSERFVKFSQAMRAADPSIEVVGPVLAGTDFTTLPSGDFDGRSWMEGFLHYVDSVEKDLGPQLVDGIDFHSYPYWPAAAPDAGEMVSKSDGTGAQFDSLLSLMDRNIANPQYRSVLMTEFNTSSYSSSLQMQASAGTAVGLQFAHFIQRFGDRGLTNTWELYSDLVTSGDGTYGTLGVFLKPTLGMWSSLGYPPSSTFWTTRAIMRQWLDTAGGDTVLPIDQIAGARMFAVSNAGRVSVLAFNLGADSATIDLDGSAFPTGGDILSWGTGEFQWNGTSATARAIPDNGPSSKAFATAASLTAKIPPYGMLLVRGSGRAKAAPRTVHWLLSSSRLTTEDTLTVSGWTTGEGVKLTSGTWSIGAKSGLLVPVDGAWDGPCESWTARIPTSAVAAGSSNLKVSVTDNMGEVASDSTAIAVTGTARAVSLIADFENKKTATAAGQAFYPYSADSNKVSAKIVARDGGGFCMRDTIVLTKPDSLNYTNFGTGFSGIANIHQLDSAFGLVGVMFDISTKHTAPSGSFAINVAMTSVKDYDNYTIAIPNTRGVWKRDTVLFSSLAQGGWGKPVPFNVDSITGLGFSGSVAGTISMSIDNIYFLGSRGNEINPVVRRVSGSRALSLAGHQLTISTTAPWTLRLVSANGRVANRWTGTGSSSLALPKMDGTRWAVLECEGVQRTLAIPPLLQ